MSIKIRNTHKLERAIILFLNGIDNWELTWVGDKNLAWDAEGYTPKKKKCIISMKFRKHYYESKMIEVKHYNDLMAQADDIVKIYFVFDPRGNYFFWLAGIKKFNKMEKYCPQTTLWSAKKAKKEVYLLPENLASYIHKEKTDINKFG